MTVYFAMEPGDDVVKIGWSKSPRLRLKGLRYKSRKKVRLIRVIDGERDQEKWLHKHYASERVGGEWFRFRPDMMTVVPPYDPAVFPPMPLRVLVDCFLSDTSMSPRLFGVKAVRDPNFVFDLRAGRHVFPKTERKVMAFIFSGGKSSEASQ